MQNKKRFILTFISFLILFVSSSVAYSKDGKFSQKLEWQKDPNAYEYKVEIRGVSDPAVYKVFNTEKSYIEFSMSAGDYTYRVSVYDFLGRESSVTEWKKFTITKALKPSVNLVDTTVTVDGKSKRPVTIPVDVNSITDESTLKFVNIETGEEIKGRINVNKNTDGSASSDSVVFPNVSVGEWKMIIQNPSGLYTESEPVKVSPAGKKLVIGKVPEKKETPVEIAQPVVEEDVKEPEAVDVAETSVEEQKTVEVAEITVTPEPEESKPETIEVTEVPVEEPETVEIAEVTVTPQPEKEAESEKEDLPPKEKKPYVVQDINLMVGAVSTFAVADEYFTSLNNSYFNYGGTIRLSWLPIDIKKVQIGFEAAYSNSFIDYMNKYLDLFIPINVYSLDVVGRLNLFNGKAGINFKAGGGVTILKKDVTYPKKTRPDVKSKHYGYPSATGGLSFNWIPFKHFITETGAEVNYIIIPDCQAVTVSPYILLGVRF